jgi:hypothetical protein
MPAGALLLTAVLLLLVHSIHHRKKQDTDRELGGLESLAFWGVWDVSTIE